MKTSFEVARYNHLDSYLVECSTMNLKQTNIICLKTLEKYSVLILETVLTVFNNGLNRSFYLNLFTL